VARMVFDPTYVPQQRMPKAEVLQGLPADAAGDRLKALSTIIAEGGSDAVLTTWLEANLGPGFLKDVPMERHLAMFKRVHADIGAHTIEAVERSGPEEYVLKLRSAKGGLFSVLVQIRPSDARISGMGVEKLDQG
jgi:hypothetical protein